MDRYRVIGPRGEGPVEVEADSSIQAAAFARFGYRLSQARGPHGAVTGYEPFGAACTKVGTFDITWLGRVGETK